MFNVILPTSDFDKATRMQKALLDDEGIYMLALLDEGSQLVYTRMSSEIYLEEGDFVRVGEAVLRWLENNE
jgi:hypothetical protein